MVTKRNTKSIRNVRPPAAAETARKLWLASLGAVSLAEKQGRRIVDTLVEEGEQFRARTSKAGNTIVRDVRRAANDAQKQVESYVIPLKQRALKAAKRIETRINTRIGSALERFGVPAKSPATARPNRVVATPSRQVKAKARKRAA